MQKLLTSDQYTFQHILYTFFFLPKRNFVLCMDFDPSNRNVALEKP